MDVGNNVNIRLDFNVLRKCLRIIAQESWGKV